MKIAPVFRQRIKAGTEAFLDVTVTDADGEPVSTTNGPVVTVDITQANGEVLISGGSTSTNGFSNTNGIYRYTLNGASNTTTNLLTAVYTASNTIATHTFEVVDDFYFSAAEMREWDSALTVSNYPNAVMHRYREFVETECENITGTAWVRRYKRLQLDGTGSPVLNLPVWNPRSVRSVRIYANASDFTELSSGELAAIEVAENGRLYRRDGGVFPAGTANVVIEVEHGYDRPPADLLEAVKKRFRHVLQDPKSAIPDRATSYTIADVGVFSISTPGMRGALTGLPDVDEKYREYDFTSLMLF